MSTHDEHRDARTDDAITHLLAYLAGTGDAAGLDAAMPHMRRRIRRRRTARTAGVSAGAMALCGALAIGAWAAPWPTVDPVEPATPTPSVSPSPSPSSSATPSQSPTETATPAAAPTALDDPRFAEGREAFPEASSVDDKLADLLCGDPVTELLDLPNTSGLELSLATADAQSGRVSITNTGSEVLGPDHWTQPPRLVFVQDGRIVDAVGWWLDGLPRLTRDDGSEVTSLAPGESFTTTTMARIVGGAGWTCGPELDRGGPSSYPEALPSGEYDVYAIAPFAPASATGRLHPTSFLVGGKVTVTVPDRPDIASAVTDPRFADGRENAVGRWECGAWVQDDVLASTEPGPFSMEITGEVDVSEAVPHAEVTLTGTGDGLPEGYLVGNPVLLWSQYSVLIDGSFWNEIADKILPADAQTDRPWDGSRWTGWSEASAEAIESLPAGQTVTTIAAGQAGWTCGTEVQTDDPASPDHPDTRPAGKYQVYALAAYVVDWENKEYQFIASEPVTVVVP